MTFQNAWRELAPSTDAASYTSRGMSWSPARKMIIMEPIVDQTFRNMTLRSAMLGPTAHSGRLQPSGCTSICRMPFGFDSQAGRGGVTPIVVSSQSARPPPCRIHMNSSATTMDEEIEGK